MRAAARIHTRATCHELQASSARRTHIESNSAACNVKSESACGRRRQVVWIWCLRRAALVGKRSLDLYLDPSSTSACGETTTPTRDRTCVGHRCYMVAPATQHCSGERNSGGRFHMSGNMAFRTIRARLRYHHRLGEIPQNCNDTQVNNFAW